MVTAQVEHLHQHAVGLFALAVGLQQLVGRVQRVVQALALRRLAHLGQPFTLAAATFGLAPAVQPAGKGVAVVERVGLQQFGAGRIGRLHLGARADGQDAVVVVHQRTGVVAQLQQPLAQVAAGTVFGHVGPQQASQAATRCRAFQVQPGQQGGVLAFQRARRVGTPLPAGHAMQGQLQAGIRGRRVHRVVVRSSGCRRPGGPATPWPGRVTGPLTLW